MKRIILSLTLILSIGGALTIGATKAFFSDTETSTANTFTAGAIDLKIDNESYYNGKFSDATSWTEKDLVLEKFFNFIDLKPDDYGEDTISLHVDTNDAYLCANVTLTSNNENGCNEPESEVDQSCGNPGIGEGELAGLVNFLWWADDGDNVLEEGETIINTGNFGQLGVGNSYSLTFADSDKNIWTGTGPIPGNTTKYIGKAWCFGAINSQPLPLGDYDSPAGDNNENDVLGEPEDGGFSCDGSGLGNESQTDTITADVSFEAVQARNNPNFQCKENCRIVEEEINVLENYSFEKPEVTHGAKWEVFETPVDGWTIEWRGDIPPTFGSQNRPALAKLELHENVLGSAYEGDQYSELDSDWGGPNDSGTGEPASITMYQDIQTVAGRPYRIKFAFAARPNTPAADNRVEVKWDGAVVHDTGNVADGNDGIEWQVISVNVVATSNVTRLQFTDLGLANSQGSFIDDIKLYSPVCQ
jgi:predicted ribosomally synthesized peptide with SipW-like signal peptide